MKAHKWSKVTREEQFFTSVLFHDILLDSKPFMALLTSKWAFPPNISIIDVGYEVCFFRDVFHAEPKLINKRYHKLEKQTFDLVLWLSDQSIVIIEAKAQQGFHTDQMRMLNQSKEIMRSLSSPEYPMNQILLVGLCSSKYKLKDSTVNNFKAIIRWKEVARYYPEHVCDYSRADDIYRDKLIDQ